MIEVGVSHLVWVRRGDGPVAMDPPDNGVVSFILAKKGGVFDVGGWCYISLQIQPLQ